MSTTVKTGWLNDKNGDKFAPKTLTSQVQTSDGILLEDKIQADLITFFAENAPDASNTVPKAPTTVGDVGKQLDHYALADHSHPKQTEIEYALRAENAETATNANIANQLTNSLKFGNKVYNGSSEQTITAEDLGLEEYINQQIQKYINEALLGGAW